MLNNKDIESAMGTLKHGEIINQSYEKCCQSGVSGFFLCFFFLIVSRETVVYGVLLVSLLLNIYKYFLTVLIANCRLDFFQVKVYEVL